MQAAGEGGGAAGGPADCHCRYGPTWFVCRSAKITTGKIPSQYVLPDKDNVEAYDKCEKCTTVAEFEIELQFNMFMEPLWGAYTDQWITLWLTPKVRIMMVEATFLTFEWCFPKEGYGNSKKWRLVPGVWNNNAQMEKNLMGESVEKLRGGTRGTTIRTPYPEKTSGATI